MQQADPAALVVAALIGIERRAEDALQDPAAAPAALLAIAILAGDARRWATNAGLEPKRRRGAGLARAVALVLAGGGCWRHPLPVDRSEQQ